MTEFILYLGVISFSTLFGLSLITLRKLENENRKLRIEIAEAEWNSIRS